MWTDLYLSYFLENIEFADVIERIQDLGFEVSFSHLDDGYGWLFLIIEENMGYQEGRSLSLREALLQGLYVLYAHEGEVLNFYTKML
tara:strand:- start:1994 stop:2254 length:261 start_codon:yes stop_codon:yes gene_type:complete